MEVYMQYDPVKNIFATMIDLFPILRRVFYFLLDILFLRNYYIKREIAKYFPTQEPLRFYDAGAGFGQYSYYILRHWSQSEVLAVDIKTDYMESFKYYASQQHWNRFKCRQADLQNYTPAKQYDLILAVDILEHIEDDIAVLKRFRNAISPRGKLIISSPSNFDESAKFTEEHVRPGYSKEEIISKLTHAGFDINLCEYSYGPWGQLYWRWGIKYPLTWIGKSKLILLFLPIYYLITFPFLRLCINHDLKQTNESGTGLVVVASPKIDASNMIG